jgi:hypothetical protein
MTEGEQRFTDELIEVVHSGDPLPWDGPEIYANLMDTIKAAHSQGKVLASATVADKPETTADDVINGLYDKLSPDRIRDLENGSSPTYEEIEACAARNLAYALEDETGWMAIDVMEIVASDKRSAFLYVEHMWDGARSGILGAYPSIETAIATLPARFDYYCDIWDWSPVVPANLRSRVELILKDRNPLTKSYGNFSPAQKR